MGTMEDPRHLGHNQQRIRMRLHHLCHLLEFLAARDSREAGDHELQCSYDRRGDHLQHRVLSRVGQDPVSRSTRGSGAGK